MSAEREGAFDVPRSRAKARRRTGVLGLVGGAMAPQERPQEPAAASGLETPPRGRSDEDRAAVLARWRPCLVALAVGIVAILALFYQTAGSMVAIWLESTAFEHAFLVVPIALYLIWRDREAVARLAPVANPLGLVLLAGAAALWLLGDFGGVQMAKHVAVVGMVQSLCLAVLGWAVVKRLAFPLFFLVFCVPFGLFLIPPLQDLTADYVVALLRLTGMPVFHDGIMIYIPSGTFEVAEACAGVRFLISTVVLGFLGARLLFRDLLRRVIFVALSAIIPIVANGVRAYGIVMLAHLSDYRIAADADHLIYGWIFLAFVTFILLGVGLLMRRGDDDGEEAPAETGSAHAAPAAPASFAVVLVLALIIAGSAPAYSRLTEGLSTQGAVYAFGELDQIGPWNLQGSGADGWRPSYRAASAQFHRVYRHGDETVELYIAYYPVQTQDAEIINDVNALDGGKGWMRINSGVIEGELDGRKRSIPYERLQGQDGMKLVSFWYWVDGRFVTGALEAKLLEIKARLLGGRRDAALVAVAANYDHELKEAIGPILSFVGNADVVRDALEGAATAR